MVLEKKIKWSLGGGREDEEEPAKELSRSCQGGGRQLREHGHLGAKGTRHQTHAEEMRTERKLLDSWQVFEDPDKGTFMGRGMSWTSAQGWFGSSCYVLLGRSETNQK